MSASWKAALASERVAIANEKIPGRGRKRKTLFLFLHFPSLCHDIFKVRNYFSFSLLKKENPLSHYILLRKGDVLCLVVYEATWKGGGQPRICPRAPLPPYSSYRSSVSRTNPGTCPPTCPPSVPPVRTANNRGNTGLKSSWQRSDMPFVFSAANVMAAYHEFLMCLFFFFEEIWVLFIHLKQNKW